MINFQTFSIFGPKALEDLFDFDTAAERKSFTQNLLFLFKGNAVDSITQLENLVRQTDWNGIAREAHKFKSGCYAIGSERLGKICAEIEAKAKSQSELESISQNLKTIKDTLPELYEKIESYIARME